MIPLANLSPVYIKMPACIFFTSVGARCRGCEKCRFGSPTVVLVTAEPYRRQGPCGTGAVVKNEAVQDLPSMVQWHLPVKVHQASSLRKVEWAVQSGISEQGAEEKSENNCYAGIAWIHPPVGYTQKYFRLGLRCWEWVGIYQPWMRVYQNLKRIPERSWGMYKQIPVDSLCHRQESRWVISQDDVIGKRGWELSSTPQTDPGLSGLWTET